VYYKFDIKTRVEHMKGLLSFKLELPKSKFLDVRDFILLGDGEVLEEFSSRAGLNSD
jgi:hypothetical protein